MFHENGPVQSVAKALRLLGLLMEAHQPLTLAALSEQTGWPKSTIHAANTDMAFVRVGVTQQQARHGAFSGAAWPDRPHSFFSS